AGLSAAGAGAGAGTSGSCAGGGAGGVGSVPAGGEGACGSAATSIDTGTTVTRDPSLTVYVKPAVPAKPASGRKVMLPSALSVTVPPVPAVTADTKSGLPSTSVSLASSAPGAMVRGRPASVASWSALPTGASSTGVTVRSA